jgi:hypothetical protein
LNARSGGISDRLIDYQPVIEVRHSHRNVANETSDTLKVLIVDVLRLVRHLVIVRV